VIIEKSRNFRFYFPSASPHALDLLQKLLVFNPSQRCTAKQLLKLGAPHPYIERFAEHDKKGEDIFL